PAQALQSVLVMGKQPTSGAPVLAGAHVHAPLAALQTVATRRAQSATPRISAKRQAYGMARALDTGTLPDDVNAYSTPWDVAVFLVFHHPEVMNLKPDLGADILDRIGSLPCASTDPTCAPYLSALAQAIAVSIEQNGYPTTTPGGWATLVAQTYADGSPLLDETGQQLYRFDIDDTIASATGKVVQQALGDIFDDPLFEGTNWHATTGIASKAGTAATPATAPTALVRALRKATGQAAGGTFDVEAEHPAGATISGVYMDSLTVTDPAARSVRLTVRNTYLRFLSTYIQYHDANDVQLPISNPGQLDSSRAQYLQMVGSNNQIMGIPYQGTDVSSTDIEFTVPDNAASATVMFGSLGLGGDAFTKEAVAGTSLTLALNIGLPTMLLAVGVYADVKDGIFALLKDEVTLQTILKSIFSALSKSGPDLAGGIYSSATTQSVQPFIAGISNVAIQVLLANAPAFTVKLFLTIGASQLAAAVPFVNVAWKVLSTLADLAAIGVSLGESLSCPAITTNKISLKMDTTVRIKRDPRDFQFPASARQYVVDATYDGGAVPRTTSGTISQGQVDPIDALLSGVPSGGMVTVKVSLYSGDGCLVGVKVLDPVKNLPDTASLIEVEIVELLAKLSADTQYQHSLKLRYENGGRNWAAATAPQFTVENLCQGQDKAICVLNGLTVHTASGMAGYGFSAGGQNINACVGGGIDSSLNTIQNLFLGQNAEQGLKFSNCGYAAPVGIVYDASGPALGGNHFFVQPTADGYHLRTITLDNATPFDLSQTTSWGRFSNALDSLAVLPSGYVVGVNRQTHKMEILRLMGAYDQSSAPTAVPFASMKAGLGTRAGLLDTPIAVATARGTILVLEQGNTRVQAFDTSGNPTPLFASKTSALMPLVPQAGAVYLDLAVEGAGYMYVLSYDSGGTLPQYYRLDVYTPDGAFLARTSGVAAARLAVDLFRNVYTLNYEPLVGSPRVEPSLSQWLPVSPNPCPSTLPASAASAGKVASCGPRSRLSRWLTA
ncbi:MAG: hypothetical protein ABIV63_20095, partial [Caldimonas sp.]